MAKLASACSQPGSESSYTVEIPESDTNEDPPRGAAAPGAADACLTTSDTMRASFSRRCSQWSAAWPFDASPATKTECSCDPQTAAASAAPSLVTTSPTATRASATSPFTASERTTVASRFCIAKAPRADPSERPGERGAWPTATTVSAMAEVPSQPVGRPKRAWASSESSPSESTVTVSGPSTPRKSSVVPSSASTVVVGVPPNTKDLSSWPMNRRRMFGVPSGSTPSPRPRSRTATPSPES
mmetsp:Transcript_16166/g.50579  ORF Transcript_16166/g.50579 Transcript_16166/m.50579 type:complete len:243 (+) Transcript_16166:2396-3124(+)